MADLWVVIPGWDEFQHYRDRDPIWLKVYTRLLSDDAYLSLTFHQRGLLQSIWLEYARANRQLSGSTLSLTRQLGQRVATRDLEALNHAGFLTFSASRPLAGRYQDASAEGEREKNPPNPPHEKTPPHPRRRDRTTADIDPMSRLPHACPHCTQRRASQAELDEHLENVHGITPVRATADDNAADWFA